MAQRLDPEALDNALKPVQAVSKVAQGAGEVKRVKGVVEEAQDADDFIAKVESIAKIADSMLGKFLSAQDAFKGIAEKKGVLESEPNNAHRQAKEQLRDEGQGVPQENNNMPKQKDIRLRVDKEFTDEYIKTIGELLNSVPDEWKKKTVGELIEMYDEDGFMIKLFKKKVTSELIAYAQQAVRVE